jgi:hypothetical protein
VLLLEFCSKARKSLSTLLLELDDELLEVELLELELLESLLALSSICTRRLSPLAPPEP